MTTEQKKSKSSKRIIYIAIAIVIVIAGAAGLILMNKQPEKKEDIAAVEIVQGEPTETATDAVSESEGITIDKNAITEEASFIPYQSGDTYMEVIAIRASDGTVRTALNTCQVCFDSGRGYYKQNGDVLICQNCGNRFTVDQVEIAKGGCNPVPVFESEKTETEDTITISGDVLSQYRVLLGKWKR